MIHRYERPVPQLFMIFNEMINAIDSLWGFLIQNLNQQWLLPEHLQTFANKIHEKRAALDNVWGFVDGTVRGISKPSRNQRTVYNGHKRKHAMYQSITTPNGMIVVC